RVIGGGSPVLIQSMTNTPTEDVAATVAQILRLEEAGCEIIRCTAPTEEACRSIKEIRKRIHIPLVADIHFDYRMAIMAVENGADKIRINPGNIGSRDRIRAVVDACRERNVPIRVGVNSGSLEKDLLEKYGGVTAQALCESALNAAAYARGFGFEDIVVSLKSSDVAMNHEAHKLFREQSDLPMHIGLTESGVGRMAELKSTAALSALLLDEIGDTMRISLTGDPLREVLLAKDILTACGKRRLGIDFISCPTCGRTQVDLPAIASRIEEALQPLSQKLAADGKFIKVAVMGCAVNGPGEAKEADFGVACGKGNGLLIAKGKQLKTVPEEEIISQLTALIEQNAR
ncbi:MAG: flavodoxin-dependent (E)-4-hydroxy-3-methylbut-2-enyl-diphosphate synthase, partial [Firmicutes bacterium]|nr:flavodoxin-dependent (E)-4-hydroxy-3-methylbut-2-enyl-diphosphate synthase [Bacillota bacterium]